MEIHIIEVEKGANYTVNNHTVYKDSENNWICPEGLTPFERSMFMAFIRLRKV